MAQTSSVVNHCPGGGAVHGPEESCVSVQHESAGEHSSLGLHQHTQAEVHCSG